MHAMFSLAQRRLVRARMGGQGSGRKRSLDQSRPSSPYRYHCNNLRFQEPPSGQLPDDDDEEGATRAPCPEAPSQDIRRLPDMPQQAIRLQEDKQDEKGGGGTSSSP